MFVINLLRYFLSDNDLSKKSIGKAVFAGVINRDILNDLLIFMAIIIFKTKLWNKLFF